MNRTLQPTLFTTTTTATAAGGTVFHETAPDLIVSFDGAMEPRQSSRARGSWGCVARRPDGTELWRESGLMAAGDCRSNNVAEYTALLQALAWVRGWLARNPGAAVLFQGDSQLVVHHCRNVWGWNKKKTVWNPHVDAPHLRGLLDEAMRGLSGLRSLAKPLSLTPGTDPKANNLPIVWVRGEDNPADGESRKPLAEAGLWHPGA